MEVLKKSERNWREYREKCYQKEKRILALERELSDTKYEPELWKTLWRYLFGAVEKDGRSWVHPGKLLTITAGGRKNEMRYLVFWILAGKIAIAFRDFKDSYAEIKIGRWIRIVKRSYKLKQKGWKIFRIEEQDAECCGG